jgi:hypothetical protein
MSPFAFDHNGGFVVSAFLITVGVIGCYALYLRSRLAGLRQRLERGEANASAERAAVPAERSREGLESSGASPL